MLLFEVRYPNFNRKISYKFDTLFQEERMGFAFKIIPCV